MATAWPGGTDNFANPSSGTALNDPAFLHHAQHANANDAIEAIEAFLGVSTAHFPGGVDSSGSPSGYNAEFRFNKNQVGGIYALTTLATSTPQMLFDHRGTGNDGVWRWRNGTGAGSDRMRLNGDGKLEIWLFSNVQKSINLRPDLADNGANLGIQTTDWNGDTNFDGLQINGSDGVGFGTVAGVTARIYRDSAASETHLGVIANGLGLSRVKFGAAGTGPGGVGRALYI